MVWFHRETLLVNLTVAQPVTILPAFYEPPRVHYRVHQRLPLIPTPSHTNSVHILTPIYKGRIVKLPLQKYSSHHIKPVHYISRIVAHTKSIFHITALYNEVLILPVHHFTGAILELYCCCFHGLKIWSEPTVLQNNSPVPQNRS
jgi:hypothetical protein